MVERKMQSPTRRTIVEGADNVQPQDVQSVRTSIQSSASPAASSSAEPTPPPSSNERLADYFAIVGL